MENDRPDTKVTTSNFVREVDDIQYDLGQGPCISAAAEGQTVRSGSLGGDPRWPRFGGRAARLGVHSAVSLPLITSAGVIGAINVYAHAEDAFDDHAAALGGVFAVPAAIAVETAQILAQTRRLFTQLQAALETRMIIDRAVGVLISSTGVSGEEALDQLRTLSERGHDKLAALAHTVVEEAASRAREREDDEPHAAVSTSEPPPAPRRSDHRPHESRKQILDKAEKRDEDADVRDAASHKREMRADLEAFLSPDQKYNGFEERQAAALDRLRAQADRKASAEDRAALTDDSAKP